MASTPAVIVTANNIKGQAGSGDAGGAIATTGGAGAATFAGGAVSLTGGAGNTSGAGGAASLVGGAGGSSAAGGAIAITAGVSTGAAGAAVTVTAGAGNGTTNAGGDVNLVPGAAASTGVPGELKVNGDANITFATYFFTGTPAATDQVFFVAPRALRVQSIKQVHSVAAGGASTLTVIKDTSTSAPGAGTSLHQSGSFNLNSTANTVQSATVSTTVATLTMATGDRLAVKFANTIQSTAGLVVTVGLSPI